MEVWFSSRKVEKAMAKISPRYLARSPVNILRAMKFMACGYSMTYSQLTAKKRC